MLPWYLRRKSRTSSPLSVDELKTNLRLPADCGLTDQNLAAKIEGAIEQFEKDTSIAVSDGVFEYGDDRVPASGRPLSIPLRGIVSVSIKYRDPDGALQDLDDDQFDFDPNRSLVIPVGDWPEVSPGPPSAILVSCTVEGAAGQVPYLAKEAVLLQAGRWFMSPAMEEAQQYTTDEAYERIVRRTIHPSYPQV